MRTPPRSMAFTSTWQAFVVYAVVFGIGSLLPILPLLQGASLALGLFCAFFAGTMRMLNQTRPLWDRDLGIWSEMRADGQYRYRCATCDESLDAPFPLDGVPGILHHPDGGFMHTIGRTTDTCGPLRLVDESEVSGEQSGEDVQAGGLPGPAMDAEDVVAVDASADEDEPRDRRGPGTSTASARGKVGPGVGDGEWVDL